MKLDELRKLEQAATPGPWEADDTTDDYSDWDWPDAKRERTGWFRGEVGNIEVGDYNTLSYADAALIAAARNALPALLDVAEAARVIVERPGVWDSGGEPWWAAHEALRAALARLEEAGPAMPNAEGSSVDAEPGAEGTAP